MNLVTDKWIPVVWLDGRHDKVSLMTVFNDGGKIADLSVRPHERIALMRLLICVAQAALDGPKDREEWRTCKEQLPREATDYLKKWQKAFELFGDGPRFLQVSLKRKTGKTDGDDSLASKLDMDLATGSNPTLFDNGGGLERSFPGARQAISLLAFQCFSTAGLIGQAIWDGQLTHGRSAPMAPCIDRCMLHSFLRGPTIIATIHMNLLSVDLVTLRYGQDAWGKPVWEKWPFSPVDAHAIQNATMTYLGRLVPVSRAILLGNDGIGAIIANGLDYTSQEHREPHATYVSEQKDDDRKILGGSPDRAIWRELNSLTVIVQDERGVGGPLPVSNVQPGEAFDLWTGCVIYNRKRVASILGSEESVFHVPASMLHDSGQRIYEEGVAHAENGYRTLRDAVRAYKKSLGEQPVDLSQCAITYWTCIEMALHCLLRIVADPAGLRAGWNGTAWGQNVRKAATLAYERTCSKDSPRQMQGYTLGYNVLMDAVKPKRNTTS